MKHTLKLILAALVFGLASCVTSYQHPPVTPETDKAINAMMTH